jgi:cellulose synthase/poly-beta-1,6-N-acetylglucosamine synthase-like glycosyltransferase
MDLPLISVIITTFNYAHTVATAIESALRQDYPNLEVVVMDNASTDDTETVVGRFTDDPRLRYVRNPENIGMNPNHNAGLRNARGTYISFLSADDWLMPDFVSTSYRYLQDHPDVDVLYTTTYFADEQGRLIGFRQMSGQPLAPYAGGRNELAGLLKEGCYMCFPTMLMKRELFERHGELDCSIKAADHEIVIRWAAAGVRFAYEPRPTCAVRLHESQQSSLTNYTANGGLLDELLHLLDKFLTPDNERKIAGSEVAIERHVSNVRDITRQVGVPIDAVLQGRIDRTLENLHAIRRRNLTDREPAFLTIGVLVEQDISLTEQTLRSLADQSSDEYEILVLHRPGRSPGPLARWLDRHGRFRAVPLIEPLGEAAMLNLAIRIARGNAFTFIRSGSLFDRDHVTRLCTAFDERRADVLLSPARLSIEHRLSASESKVLAVHDDAYPHPSLEALSIAPALPLESIAFRSHAADQAGPFDESLPALAAWEYFQRLRTGTAIDALANAVTVRAFVGNAAPELRLAQLGHLSVAFETVYRSYSGEVRLEEMRREYIARINDGLAKGAADETDPSGLLRAYQLFSGLAATRPLQPA